MKLVMHVAAVVVAGALTGCSPRPANPVEPPHVEMTPIPDAAPRHSHRHKTETPQPPPQKPAPPDVSTAPTPGADAQPQQPSAPDHPETPESLWLKAIGR